MKDKLTINSLKHKSIKIKNKEAHQLSAKANSRYTWLTKSCCCNFSKLRT